MKKILFSLLLSICCFISNAQNPIHYTPKQGFPSNNIYDAKQDSNGFMWFATNRGIVKYDGVNTKVFTIKDGLPNNDVFLLEADKQGRIWFLSKSKYQGYIKNDSIHTFLYPDDQAARPYITISDSIVWFSGCEWTYKFENDELKKVRRESFTRKNIGFNLLNSQYIRYDNAKLYVDDSNHNLLYIIPVENNVLNLASVLSCKSVDNGLIYNNVFYFITEKGILLINFSSKKARYYTFKELIKQEAISNVRCNALPSEIQVSTSGYLITFNYNLELVDTPISFPNHIKYHNSYRDKDGNIWLTDLSEGITLFTNTQRQNQYYLKNKKVQKIGFVNGELFAGVRNDAYYKFSTEKNRFQKALKFPVDENIYHIKSDQQKETTYFISSTNIYRLNRESKEKEQTINDFIINGAKDFIEYEGYLYKITVGGLEILNLRNQQRKNIGKRGLMHAEVFNDSIYIAGSDGLFMLKNDSLIKPTVNSELLNVSINTLSKDKQYLFVGTNGTGLYLYNNEVTHLKNTENLAIQKVLKKENILWLATNRGVKRMELDKNDIANSKITNTFYEADGLLENNVNDIIIKDNMLFVASDLGVVQIDLNNPLYKKKPKLYFKNVEDTLHVNYAKNNHIPITFAVLDYVNQEYFTYKYRLLPFQKKWIETTTKTINFSNLSPKLYTLEVQAKDQHGNKIIERININVIPAWWQKGWMKLLYLFFGILLFVGLIKIIQHRIQKKELKKRIREKHIARLELQALRSQMNPHFVYNSLNAIQYYIQRNEVELSEKYLSKFATLIRLFFEYSRKKHITLEAEIALLHNYLEIEQLRFEDHLQYSISVDQQLNTYECIIPSMILQPIVENAVNHGIFHKEESGFVHIHFKYINATSFQVEVKDDGIGIEKAQEISRKSVKNYESRSSDIILERIQILNQQKDWEINNQVKDLFKLQETQGTLVILTFNQLEK